MNATDLDKLAASIPDIEDPEVREMMAMLVADLRFAWRQVGVLRRERDRAKVDRARIGRAIMIADYAASMFYVDSESDEVHMGALGAIAQMLADLADLPEGYTSINAHAWADESDCALMRQWSQIHSNMAQQAGIDPWWRRTQ